MRRFFLLIVFTTRLLHFCYRPMHSSLATITKSQYCVSVKKNLGTKKSLKRKLRAQSTKRKLSSTLLLIPVMISSYEFQTCCQLDLNIVQLKNIETKKLSTQLKTFLNLKCSTFFLNRAFLGFHVPQQILFSYGLP